MLEESTHRFSIVEIVALTIEEEKFKRNNIDGVIRAERTREKCRYIRSAAVNRKMGFVGASVVARNK